VRQPKGSRTPRILLGGEKRGINVGLTKRKEKNGLLVPNPRTDFIDSTMKGG